MVAPGSRSRSAASAMRQPVRNAIGGSPTSSLKRRASAARETPVASASSATVHGCAGSWCSSRSAGPTTGSPWARYQPGASASGRANQARSDGDQQQVEQPVEHRLLARLVLDDLVGQQRDERAVPGVVAQHEQRRQRAQQPPADLAVELVGAGQHHRRAVARRCPTCARRGRIICASSSPSGVVQRWPGWMTACGAVAGIVGDGVRVGPADDGDVAAAEPHRRAVVAGAIQASPRTTATSVSGASSSMRSDHGGSSSSAAGRRRARGARRAGRRRRPCARIVDARA